MKKFFYEYRQLNWLYVLFAVNVIGFLIAFFASVFSNGESFYFFAIHSDDSLSLVKIWKLVTYSLATTHPLALIGNLLWLWIFGDLLAKIIGGKFLFSLYVVATLVVGIIAGVFCFWANTKFPVFLLGFDVALIAIASACVYKAPQQKVVMMLLGGIPIWVLGIAFLLIKIFTTPTKGFAFMLVLDFIAIFIGVFYIVLFEKGKAMDVTNFNNIFKRKPKIKGRVISMPNSKKATEASQQSKLNTILDKISAKGIESITKEEKQFLENYRK